MQLRVNGTTLSGETVGEGAPCLCLHGGPGTDSSSTLAVFERSGHSPTWKSARRSRSASASSWPAPADAHLPVQRTAFSDW
jgi:hypothetical protein